MSEGVDGGDGGVLCPVHDCHLDVEQRQSQAGANDDGPEDPLPIVPTYLEIQHAVDGGVVQILAKVGHVVTSTTAAASFFPLNKICPVELFLFCCKAFTKNIIGSKALQHIQIEVVRCDNSWTTKIICLTKVQFLSRLANLL